MAAERETEIPLTDEAIDAFLNEMRTRDCKTCSLNSYRQILSGLAAYLPPGSGISETTGGEWKAWMEERGYSRRTINARLSAYNSFLKYMGKREWQETDFSKKPDSIQPELTRAEYIRLLKTAKRLGREREYLLIKLMGSAGVRSQELDRVTAEAVRDGSIRTESYHRKRLLRLPDCLRKELLSYARREGIQKGPLFLARDGTPLVRSTVWSCVNGISSDARVDEEKVNPRSLFRLYCGTRDGLEAGIRAMAEQAYERILEEEQLEIGWEE